MEKGNIVLMGMPGSGKSTTGVVLAKTLRMPFTDTDLVIQQRSGKRLQDIIDKEGMERFLSLEEKYILELNPERHVIATGGSVVYSSQALLHLRKKDGIIVYFQLRLDEISERIRNITTRGIAMKLGQSLIELYRERVPLYEKYADVIIECSGMGIEETVKEISERLKEYEGTRT